MATTAPIDWSGSAGGGWNRLGLGDGLCTKTSAVTVTRTMLRYVTRTSWGRRLELYHVER